MLKENNKIQIHKTKQINRLVKFKREKKTLLISSIVDASCLTYSTVEAWKKLAKNCTVFGYDLILNVKLRSSRKKLNREPLFVW